MTFVLAGTRYSVSLIKNDMLKLENQLPFFILKDILNLANISAPWQIQTHKKIIIEKNEKLSLYKLIYLLYRTREEFRVPFYNIEDFDSSEALHLLDFLRLFHLPPFEVRESRARTAMKVGADQIPSVTELQQAGVEFRRAESTNLYDVKFDHHKGVFKMPRFYLVTITEILFRNMLVFEQFRYPYHQHVADYMRFLNYLVHEPNDVKTLVRSGSFQNGLDDNHEAATLINNIGRNTADYTHGFYFSDVVEELVSYYNNPWHGFVAKLKRNYFNSPWAAISAVAAAVLLISSVLQTVFTVLKRM